MPRRSGRFTACVRGDHAPVCIRKNRHPRLRRARVRAGSGGGCARCRLPQPCRDAGRALSAGRRRRRHGARGGRQAFGCVPAAGDRRQQTGRRRHHRHPLRRPCPRPTAIRCSSATPARFRSTPVFTSCRLRSAQELRADRAGRLDAGGADRQSLVLGQNGRRIHRAHQATARQDQRRHFGARHRRFYDRRAFQVGGRRRRGHHPLQRHGPADDRSARRARAGGVRRAAAGARQHPGRQVARHRGHQAKRFRCCPTCRPLPNPACPASKPCCITAC